MISIKANEKWLDLDRNQKITLEITNPLFDDGIRGLLTYPFSLNLQNNENRKALGWPDRLANVNPEESIEDVELYLKNWLYKIGVMKYRGQNAGTGSYNFQCDAGAIANLIDGVKLTDLDLGTEALSLAVLDNNFPTYNYALFPVYNPNFYGDKNDEFLDYQNYYDGGFPSNSDFNNNHCITPFPYLVYILTKIFDTYGYSISGDWITNAEVRKIVLHSNYAIDKIIGIQNVYGDTIDFKNHVPDMTIKSFLVAVKTFLGLGLIFNSNTKEVEIVKLDDVIDTDEYEDWTSKVGKSYDDVPVDYRGVTLKCNQDQTDKYMEQYGNDWLEYRIDNGLEPITVDASTLHVKTAKDKINTSRTWTIPHVLQSGSSPEFDLGTNKHPLRLLYYKGIVSGYPQGHYVGDSIDLRWKGASGLYETSHKKWLDFRKYGKPVKRKVNLSILDLDRLNPKTHIMIDHLRYLWKSIRVNVTPKQLEIADAELILKKY